MTITTVTHTWWTRFCDAVRAWWNIVDDDLPELPQPDDDAPLVAPAPVVPAHVGVGLYPLLCPAPDPDVWVDPDAQRWRENLAQECAELELHWAAQADDLGRMHAEIEQWLAQTYAAARQRLDLAGAAA